jgi:hypothetical protein
MNGGLATASQVRDGEKGLKQKLLPRESTIKIFINITSLISVAPDILDVQVRRKRVYLH